MKGLLIKDFKLMKGQKHFFFINLIIVIGMGAFYDDLLFMVSFLTFVISLFTSSTISYDEFDNGNAFLFTLPISRTSYTVEKYCLILLLGGSSWIFSTLLAIFFGTTREIATASEVFLMSATILPALFVMQAIMIPFQLKYGVEKGRIAIICTFGCLFVMSIAGTRAAKMLGINIAHIINHLSIVNIEWLVAASVIISLVIWFISMKISISIMRKKEF